MSGVAWLVLVFVVFALLLLVGVWYLARRVKGSLDDQETAVSGARAPLELAPDNALRLHELSHEPILLKQGDDGVRVQIEHRPMLPLMAYAGRDVSSALGEAVARVSELWGPRWVVLLTAREDGSASVQRLA